MEFMNTPMNNILNQNENLIIQSEQNKAQNINVNQYFVENNAQSSKEYSTFDIKFDCSNIIAYTLSIVFILACLISVIVVSNLDIYLRIAIGILGVIFLLILMRLYAFKIKLIKDKSNGKVIVKVINFLCFPKMKLNLDIENTHFDD